jgi:acetyl-CoA acetyltransferase
MLTKPAIPVGAAGSSPFAKWGYSLAEVSSLELAATVTRAALRSAEIDPAQFDSIVLGWTIPQADIFYGAPGLATEIGA